MNKVYKSPTMVVHDDREPLTFEQAFDRLWDGRAVRICYPPDFSAEDECNIYDDDYTLFLSDITKQGLYDEKFKTQCKQAAYEYLRGYEIYK